MHQHKHGFTIIEVSLVLAIAGLILVMAFIALPALQRQSRDAKRKEDTMLFIQALKKYQQNNRGQLPTTNFENSDAADKKHSIIRLSGFEPNTWETIEQNTHEWASFYNKYLGEKFINPDGEKYTFYLQLFPQIPNTGFTYDVIQRELKEYAFADRWSDFFIFFQAKCKSDGTPEKSDNPRNLAIITLLEAGTYCADM